MPDSFRWFCTLLKDPYPYESEKKIKYKWQIWLNINSKIFPSTLSGLAINDKLRDVWSQ